MQRVDLERAARGAARRRVTRRFLRGRWAVALAALAAAVAVLTIVDFASTGSKARGRGPGARVLGGRGAGELARRAERARRDHGPDVRSREDDLRDGGLPAVHDGLGPPDPERGRRRGHPGAGAACEGRRHDPRPLREPRHRLQPAALDALPRRPLPAGLRRRLRPGLLGAGRERRAGKDVHLPADRRPGLRRGLALPRPLAVDGRVDRRWALRRALDPGPGSAAPGPRVRRLLRVDTRLQDDRRPRVRRQHAGLPRQGRRPRPVGRARARRGLPHLPRPRPPLAAPRRHEHRHARRSGRRRASACGGGRTTPAPGSTTATSRATWRTG